MPQEDPNFATPCTHSSSRTWTKLIFGLTLATISIIILLTGIATRNLQIFDILSFYGAILVTILLNIFGLTSIDKVPIRRLLFRWSEKASVSILSKILVVLVFGSVLTEFSSVAYCWYHRHLFFTHLDQAWAERRNPETAPLHIARAYALFPNRPEPYIVYHRARNYFGSVQHRQAKLRQFSNLFLTNFKTCDNTSFRPFLFCCSCMPKKHYYLLPQVALADVADLRSATLTEPTRNDIDAYLLWLYHMSERSDVPLVEVFSKMQNVISQGNFHNSPIFPLVLDHFFQYKLNNNNCSEKLISYTEDYIAYYNSIEEFDPVSPPSKTKLYYIILRIHSGYETEHYEDLDNEITHILSACSAYAENLRDKLNENSSIVGKLNEFQGAFSSESGVREYLSDGKNRNWLSL